MTPLADRACPTRMGLSKISESAMKNCILSRLCIALCLCLDAAGVVAQQKQSAVQSNFHVICEPRRDRLLQSLRDAQGRSVSFYGDHRCPGGPYLEDGAQEWPGQEPTLVKLVKWWLYEFINARWTDEGRAEISVRARYITGIGPTGNQPFSVQVKARRMGDGRQVDEPEIAEQGGSAEPTARRPPAARERRAVQQP